jgi:hypothetical protein
MAISQMRLGGRQWNRFSSSWGSVTSSEKIAALRHEISLFTRAPWRGELVILSLQATGVLIRIIRYPKRRQVGQAHIRFGSSFRENRLMSQVLRSLHKRDSPRNRREFLSN